MKSLRRDYFNSISDNLIKKSLIFIDPDNGMQVKKSDEKHVLYIDTAQLYKRMDENSILIISQFFPREDHHIYTEKRRNEIYEIIKAKPSVISDNVVIYFFLSKKDSIKKSLDEALINYQKSYPELWFRIK